MVRQHQPGHGLSQRRQRGKRQAFSSLRLVNTVAQQAASFGIQPLPLESLCLRVRIGASGQPTQPTRIVVIAHKGLEQAHRHPFMTIVIALPQARLLEAILERLCRFPKSCIRAASAVSAVISGK